MFSNYRIFLPRIASSIFYTILKNYKQPKPKTMFLILDLHLALVYAISLHLHSPLLPHFLLSLLHPELALPSLSQIKISLRSFAHHYVSRSSINLYTPRWLRGILDHFNHLCFCMPNDWLYKKIKFYELILLDKKLL